MKIVFLLAAILVCSQALFSQVANNEDPLTIRELKLTRAQQKKIRKINHDAAVEINLLEKNADGSEENAIKIAKIRGARIKKITNALTPEQQVLWRKKIRENKPRRGVTGLPNERTVH
jgi:Spy/CpxP family protein refolding chaperone